MARRVTSLACVAIIASVLMATSHADDKLLRPRLENYASYNEFLAAMYAYKKQLELEKKFADSLVIKIDLPETAAATGGAVSSMPAKSPELSPQVDVYIPPLIINGPESLEYAIEAAKSFLHPIYHDKLRYNRTTAQSFPLKPMDAPVLEEASISNGLKLDFSPDNELKVADGLAAVTQQKIREAADPDEKEQDAAQRLLIKMEEFVPTDVFIMGNDINSVSISVSTH